MEKYYCNVADYVFEISVNVTNWEIIIPDEEHLIKKLELDSFIKSDYNIEISEVNNDNYKNLGQGIFLHFNQKQSKIKVLIDKDKSYDCGARDDFNLLSESIILVVREVLVNQRNGFFIHAAGIKKNGNIILITGHSGSGKTTFYNKNANFSRIHDDILAIRQKSNLIYAYGLPRLSSSGVYGSNTTGAVNNIIILKRGNNYNFKENINIKEVLNSISEQIMVLPKSKNNLVWLYNLLLEMPNNKIKFHIAELPEHGEWPNIVDTIR